MREKIRRVATKLNPAKLFSPATRERFLLWRRVGKPRRRTVVILASIVGVLFVFHGWLSLTNPYARWNIVQQPYTTSVQDGIITVQKHFDLHASGDGLSRFLGYYKSGFLILQNTYFGSQPAKSDTVDGIISDIHNLRFDPSKPYLISGDQFSVLYPRNLGVFYNSVLDPNTALSQQDWENKQRIYLQSALYAIDAFTSAGTLTTTIVPIGPHSAVLTEVHPGSAPSDSLYGILYALNALQDQSAYPNAKYKLQTVQVAKEITSMRKDDLNKLLQIYLDQVRDSSTGLVKTNAELAGARDGVTRQSSFYDNVILWKTLQLAKKLGIADAPDATLDALRTKILQTYWDDSEGHFKDDVASHPANANYSSDWLIALPTGFLDPANPADQSYLTRSIDFIHAQHVADPFPIKYITASTPTNVPFIVKAFVPNYGGDAIWSYWGAQYMTLLAQLDVAQKSSTYQSELQQDINTYKQKMIETRGYPETFTPQGAFLQNLVYKSIRQTGWVVQFEQAMEVASPTKNSQP